MRGLGRSLSFISSSSVPQGSEQQTLDPDTYPVSVTERGVNLRLERPGLSALSSTHLYLTHNTRYQGYEGINNEDRQAFQLTAVNLWVGQRTVLIHALIIHVYLLSTWECQEQVNFTCRLDDKGQGYIPASSQDAELHLFKLYTNSMQSRCRTAPI